MRISRLMVDGVVEAPGGAAFTSCVPDYERDEAMQKAYASTPWDEFSKGWLA
jgi:glutaconate CoA-transferase subunit A